MEHSMETSAVQIPHQHHHHSHRSGKRQPSRHKRRKKVMRRLAILFFILIVMLAGLCILLRRQNRMNTGVARSYGGLDQLQKKHAVNMRRMTLQLFKRLLTMVGAQMSAPRLHQLQMLVYSFAPSKPHEYWRWPDHTAVY
jgi:hypothetical protein